MRQQMDAVVAAIHPKRGGGGAAQTSSKPSETLADRVEKVVGITMTEKEKAAIEKERREAAMYWPVSLNPKLKPKGCVVSDDRMSFTSTKGYKTCVASHGVKTAGAYYYEIAIIALGETGHARVGWKSKSGERNAPVGFDKFGYGYKDIGGEKVHQGVTSAYGEPFKEGDVIGCYIYVDADVPVKARGTKVTTVNAASEPTENASFIAFARNGAFQGKAFESLTSGDGAYFPAGSLYTMPDVEPAQLKFNFGPTWAFPPDVDAVGFVAPRPMSHFAPPRPPPQEVKTEPEDAKAVDTELQDAKPAISSDEPKPTIALEGFPTSAKPSAT